MINEFICKVCGATFRHRDYPDFRDAERAMTEHIKTNHGLKNSDIYHVGKTNSGDK